MNFQPTRGAEFATSGARGNCALPEFFVGLALQCLRIAIANLNRAEKDAPGVSRDAIEHCRRAMEPLEEAYPGSANRRVG